MNIRFDQPHCLWLLLLALPIVWLGVRSLGTLDAARRWTAIVLRLLVLTLLVLMLAGIQTVRWHKDLTVVAVIDRSESVRRFAQPPPEAAGEHPREAASLDQWIDHYIRTAAKKKQREDRIGVVTFDARPSIRALPSLVYEPGSAVDDPREGTDLAAGIRLGMAGFNPDSGKRMLLVSDGNDTVWASGSSSAILAAAREAAAAGVPIDVLPLEYQLDREVMVEAVHAPAQARQGQTVALRVVLRATAPTPGLLFLRRDDQLVDLSPGAPSDGAAVRAEDWTRDDSGLEPGENESIPGGRYVCVRMIQLPMGQSGASRFEALFEPYASGDDEPLDRITVNNRAEAFTLVHGKGRVLVVDNLGAGAGDILPEALRRHGIELDVIPAANFPGTLSALHRYDAVFLQNVPAEMVIPSQQRLLAQYVNDLGGGMVMIGGPDSFGAGGWTHTPIDKILPVECQIPSQTILPSGALVIVLDRSGSMYSGVAGSPYNKMQIAQEAAVQALLTLYPQDMIGVVVFDSSAKWVVNLTTNSNPRQIANQIRSIEPGGGTNIYPGLEEAYNALAPLTTQDAAVKHVILLTDGQSMPGPYHKVVGNMAKAGISLSTVGVGDDVDGPFLLQLAQMAGGTYYPVTNPSHLPQVFIKEARTIRKNLIRETSFVPRFVRTGSPVIPGLETPPPLLGLVLTGFKNDPRVFVPMLGPEGEPLFAHWQVGLGRTAAFTSDATNRWATPWLSWEGYADFWARIARAIARPSASRAFDLATTIENDMLRLRLDATTSLTEGTAPAASFQNFLEVVGTVLLPDGGAQRVRLLQTGPGVYEADVPAPHTGNYIVSLFAADPASGSPPQAIFGGLSKPPGAELRHFASNRALLEQIARITGGRVLDPASPQTADLFTRQNIVASRSIRPLWRTLLVWLLVLVLLDVAARRIAWDLAGIGRFVSGQVGALRQRLAGRGAQASATLAVLKKRAAVVEKKLAAEPTGSPGLAPPRADRKFEATQDAQPAEDFAAAVGAAASDDGPRPDWASTTQRPSEDAPSTSRLLDAKRRAQQRMADKTKEI